MRRFQVGVTEARRELIVQAGAALGALLIVISLFLPWFTIGIADSIQALAQAGVESELGSAEELGDVGATDELGAASELLDSTVDFSGWSSLEFADALLLFVAIAAAMLALGRRRGEPEAKPREAGDALLLLGLLAVVTVVVLLFTKNSVLGMLGSSIDFAQDKAADFGQPAAGDIQLLDISPGIGLWIGLLGSLLTLVAGFFHGLVDPTGVEGPRSQSTATPGAAATTTPATGAGPGGTTSADAPTTPQPQQPDRDPDSRPPGTA